MKSKTASLVALVCVAAVMAFVITAVSISKENANATDAAAEPAANADMTDGTTIKLRIGDSVMTVDGQERAIDENGTVPIIRNNRTLLPVRAVVEAMGGSVEWDGATQTATLSHGGNVIRLTIGSSTAYLNAAPQTLDVTPVIINSRTMLPIRFIAESFGFNVAWDGGNREVTLSVEPSGRQPQESGFAEASGLRLTANNSVLDVVNHPAFKGFGHLTMPWDNRAYSDSIKLSDISSLLPYHSNIDADAVVGALNRMIDDVSGGESVFYSFYTERQKSDDPSKNAAGLFFYRGEPDAPFAVVCAGGGFSYVGSLHEGFPLAAEISEKGYNAFALKYRVGSERTATEDLAAALSWIFANAETLGVGTEDYSLWGGSAGARMVANLGSYGAAAYGGDDLPKPAVVVMQYTGHSDYTENDPPTFACVGENDGIASPQTMERRVNALKALGIDTEFHVYPNLGHGFGLGLGTSAAGWQEDALAFWGKHLSSKNPVDIPAELAAIPQEYHTPAKRQGTLVELNYDTYESMTYEQKTRKLQKRAIVYLPYGYSDERQYDVFYLMHGGWSNEAGTLGMPDNPSVFKNVIDNAIAAGEFEPLIIVCPTYNNTSPQDSASFSLALELNRNYHNELLNDLIPAVESKYSTYAQSATKNDLVASRDHRGFGGFSMGSVATWRTFQNGLDYFRYYLPMSCGTSLDEENIFAAAETHDPSDYFVWVITGTNDFAYFYDENRAELMRESQYFAENINFAYSVKEGYSHDGLAASEYTYNGLRLFWNSNND